MSRRAGSRRRKPTLSKHTRPSCAMCSINGPRARGSGSQPRSGKTAASSRTYATPPTPCRSRRRISKSFSRSAIFRRREEAPFLESFDAGPSQPHRQVRDEPEPAQPETRGLRLRRRRKNRAFDELVRETARRLALLVAAQRLNERASGMSRRARRHRRVEGSDSGGMGKAMKKFLNSPQTLLDESLDGFVAAHADIVVAGEERKFVRRKELKPGKVALDLRRRLGTRTAACRIRRPRHAGRGMPWTNFHLADARSDGRRGRGRRSGRGRPASSSRTMKATS